MRVRLASLLAFLWCAPAFAQDAVGNVGLRSIDVPTASLAPLEASLDRSISLHAPAARGKTATLSALAADPEVSSRRAEARRAADSGANAMRQLELEKAQEEFDRSLTLFVAAHGDRLEPAEVSRIYTTRAKVAQMIRVNALMKEEFERALPLHPTKQLDPNTFPPESIALFQQVQQRALQEPLAPPATAPLADIAKRTRVKWIVAGEVRAASGGGHRVSLAIVDAAGNTRSTELFAPAADPNAAFDAAVARLFADAGVPKPLVGAGTPAEPLATAVAVATPRPVPTQALPRATPTPAPRRTTAAAPPWYRRWYVLAGAAALAVGAGAAVAASASGGERKETQPPPPDEGVTLVIERP